jgi:hypothetical protein
VATTCTPIGMPSLLVPNLMDRAGRPVVLNGTGVDDTWKAPTVRALT